LLLGVPELRPESNGIVERFNGTVRDESNDQYGANVLQAEQIVDHYALRAFEVNALDYLQKPIERERLALALKKARSRLSETAPAAAAPTSRVKTRQDQIFIKDGERCYFVRLHEVQLFAVEGNYARAYFRDQKPMLARALNHLEQRLDPTQFFRASRQHLINLEHIQSISADLGDGLSVQLKNGMQIEVSRRQARALRELLEL